ncbi:DotU family type IV/VI secretion system protein [Cronobacter universalis]|nr:DotU family type IV/VI secretion system protein [Cronobacter universalis]
MVTCDMLFEKIVTTEILLAMDGIIPSFSALKLRLTTTLDEFCRSLIAAGAPEEDVDTLCKILCIAVDARARTALDRQALSWEGYALTHHYYGYENEPFAVAEALDSLLRRQDFHFAAYARELLFLLTPLFPADRALHALRFQHHMAIPPSVAQSMAASPVSRRHDGTRHRNGTLVVFSILSIAALSGLWWWCARALSGPH